ncbi:MAG: hypothetical protein AMR96_01045 [Candidatus Adiutrix intracellularis]|jgi:outer membrane lipoprotein SlyB|nr:MAG: hypothetical protein AMR96_01045 [Candidatus Adiutrix intracellularis]MDR2827347.1 glycine zipper 2TM domain-containing protein [Candidatus Adiutrix intracellularis]
MSKPPFFILALLLFLLLVASTGCSPRVGGNDYNVSSTRTNQKVQTGRITSIREVKIVNDPNNGKTELSTVGGAVVGGVLGSLIGGGSGQTVATVGGAVLGAAAGYGGSRVLTEQNGIEITVKLDSGETVVITQGTDITLTSNQRVKIISGVDAVRVVPE